jgi:hypothetical protein
MMEALGSSENFGSYQSHTALTSQKTAFFMPLLSLCHDLALLSGDEIATF